MNKIKEWIIMNLQLAIILKLNILTDEQLNSLNWQDFFL